jgi:quinol monooxygenase YgiN
MFRRAILIAVPLFALSLADVRADDENPIVTLAKTKVKDKTKPFGMTVTFKVKAGQEKAFEEAFGPCLTATRKESGCICYFLNRDIDEPSNFVVYEKFKSIAALEQHAKSKHVEEVLKKIVPMLEAEPAVKVFTPAAE